MKSARPAITIYYHAIGLALAIVAQALFGPSLLTFLVEAAASRFMGPKLFLAYCFFSLLPFTAAFGLFTVLVAPAIYAAAGSVAGIIIWRCLPWRMTFHSC